MNILFRLVIGVGIVCLLGLTAPISAAATSPTPVASRTSHFDWEFSGDNAILLPAPETHLLDLDGLLEPPSQHTYPAVAPISGEVFQNALPTAGIRHAADGTWVSPGRANSQGNTIGLQPPSLPVSLVSSSSPVAQSAVEADAINVWLPQLIQQWTGDTSIAAMPWAAIGAGALILILLARMLRTQPTAKQKPHARKPSSTSLRPVAQISPVSNTLKLHPSATTGTIDGNRDAELEDWIVEGADSPADHVLRDKSEERRQLESWRKLSQVASKAFILREEEEAAKQNALWLSLVAVALGVSGLGIIATSALGLYSLLCGVCLAAMSVVILSWGGLKVVFHQLRRWILLRPVRS